MSFVRAIQILFAIALASPVVADNSFSVAPGRVTIDLSKQPVQAFVVTNNGSGPIRIEAEPVYLAANDQALNIGEPLSAEVEAAESLTPYIKISPRRFSLAAGESRSLRVGLIGASRLREPGDYRAHVMVRMLEVARQMQSTSEQGLGFEIDMKMQTGVAIYARRGEAKPTLEITCQKHDHGIVLQTTNPSPWRFDAPLNLLNAEGQVLTRQHALVLRQSQRAFPLYGNEIHAVQWHQNGEQKQVSCSG